MSKPASEVEPLVAREYRNTYIARNLEEGKCKKCPLPRSPFSKLYCEVHREKHAAAALASYHRCRERKEAS